ncbi:hypothetical protein Pyrde_0494 [Pyrodictium delaneyi]|uniref:HTH bat-type domain-containing protein n=2 Tax=Pyrodictium delaneyi TaxID=1273541 RepID=A0A0P0N1R8_9CREN|nr:hypothetical protein Pyrde_0494 [Pyrodictium delaneyi]
MYNLSHKSSVVYCLRELDCPLYDVVKAAYVSSNVRRLHGNDGSKMSVDGILGGDGATRLALRILRVNLYDDNYTEIWVRVSGDKVLVDNFDKQLRLAKEIYFQQVYSNKFNKVVRIIIPKSKCHRCLLSTPCNKCPLISTPLGSMAKSVVVTPMGALYEFIVARGSTYEELRRWGCKPIHSHGIDEYDYMLTEKQELAIIYAYLMGYYSFPRRISLKGLASKLGLSVSTLAELLRRAEAKIIDAFVRHELPHYIVGRALYGNRQTSIVEERLSSRHRVEERAKTGAGIEEAAEATVT